MRSWLLGGLIVGVIITVVNYQLFVTMANRIGSQVLYPVLCVQQCVQTWRQDRLSEHGRVIDLQQRVQVLEQERRHLLQELITLYATQHQAATTASLRRFKERIGAGNGVIGRVLVCHSDGLEHFLFVEGGQRCAVTTDMLALVDNHLIGRVMAVFPHYCKVVLITDKHINITAYCAQTGATGIYHGCSQSGQQPQGKLAFVDHLQEIVVGDTVLSSGEGLVYPEGLCLGTVVACTKTGIEYDINVHPRIDIRRVSYCLLASPAQLVTAGN